MGEKINGKQGKGYEKKCLAIYSAELLRVNMCCVVLFSNVDLSKCTFSTFPRQERSHSQEKFLRFNAPPPVTRRLIDNYSSKPQQSKKNKKNVSSPPSSPCTAAAVLWSMAASTTPEYTPSFASPPQPPPFYGGCSGDRALMPRCISLWIL